jgi:hypothetical protein
MATPDSEGKSGIFMAADRFMIEIQVKP